MMNDINKEVLKKAELFDQMKSKLSLMFSSYENYSKTKEHKYLKIAKAIEADVKEILNPKPKQTNQSTFDWLAQ